MRFEREYEERKKKGKMKNERK